MNDIKFGGCPFCGKQDCVAGSCKQPAQMVTPYISQEQFDRVFPKATPEESSAVGEQPPQAERKPMTEDEIVAIAHLVGSTYAHRSDPTTHSYGFVKLTLVDFVRKIEAHHGIGNNLKG